MKTNEYSGRRGFQNGRGAGVESGVYTCNTCGKKTRETGECESGAGMCALCFYEAGLENEHSDSGHSELDANCPTCRAVIREREAVPQTITVTLTARELRILELITCLDVDVPRVVVNASAMFAEERTSGWMKRAAQKDEVADLLGKVRAVLPGRPRLA